MEELNQKTWIILIQKKPKGPISEEDMRTLLDSKVIQYNDLAICLAEGIKPDWKFIWQFPEFDRRDFPEDERNTVLANFPIEEKRGQAPPPMPAAEVPVDLLDISPEELILSTQPQTPPELFNRFDADIRGSDDLSDRQSSLFKKAGAWSALAGILGALIIWSQSSSIEERTPPVVEIAKGPKRAIAKGGMPLSSIEKDAPPKAREDSDTRRPMPAVPSVYSESRNRELADEREQEEREAAYREREDEDWPTPSKNKKRGRQNAAGRVRSPALQAEIENAQEEAEAADEFEDTAEPDEAE